MTNFKNHKVSVSQLIGLIPEALLTHLSSNTNVDYYTKVLHAKKVFYLLLYGILDNEKLSQRTLEDTFNDSGFKVLFDLDKRETVVRSSISERLSKIDYHYFKEVYEFIYTTFSDYYAYSEQLKYNLIRVDSTMVSEMSGKLKEGLDNKSGKKSVKYSVTFDGILPSGFEVFTQAKFSSEDQALPQVIASHILQNTNHKNIYVIDRGLQSTQTMSEFSSKKIEFVARAKENRKYEELSSLINSNTDCDLGSLTLLKDSKVYLYTGKPIQNKKGNLHYREEIVQTPLRLIMTESKNNREYKMAFITNNFNLTAKEITDIYKKRWDIEVFFRFIKQELNVSHLVSLNENGIKVMLYMTLIAAMLILVYKQANNLSYKTAKRRFKIEVRNLLIREIVILSGGNPNIHFKT